MATKIVLLKEMPINYGQKLSTPQGYEKVII